jgi:hypothetical protein
MLDRHEGGTEMATKIYESDRTQSTYSPSIDRHYRTDNYEFRFDTRADGGVLREVATLHSIYAVVNGERGRAVVDRSYDAAFSEVVAGDEAAALLPILAAEERRAIAMLRARHEQAAAEERRNALAAQRAQAGTPVFVRFGVAPPDERSYNHRDGYYEQGVSAYRAHRVGARTYYLDLADTDAASALFIANNGAAFYEVSGDEIGEGADGEPLLRNVTATRVKNPKIEAIA